MVTMPGFIGLSACTAGFLVDVVGLIDGRLVVSGVLVGLVFTVTSLGSNFHKNTDYFLPQGSRT